MFRYNELSIGARLGLGHGVILVFMVGVVILGLMGMGHINDKMADVVNRNNKRIWYAHMLIDSVHHEERAVLTSMVTDEEASRVFEGVKILTGRAVCREALESLERLADSHRGREILERLRLALDANEKMSDRLLALVDTGKRRRATELYATQMHPYILSLHQLCSELITVQESENQQRHNEALSTYGRTRAAFLLLSGFAVAVAIVTSSMLSRGISLPLRQGVAIANQLAEGKVPASIEVRRKDETGQLLSAMEHMVKKLGQMRELEKQLAESQKLETLGRLSGGIAHDFNNILNIILGNAQLIRMSPTIDARTADRCVSIETAVDKAAGFIRQLLAFSKQQSLELRPTRLNDAVLDFEKMMRRMMGEHIEIRIETDPGLPLVEADRNGINQVLLNLLVNAKEAMPDGGTLTIQTCGVHVDEVFCRAEPGATAGRYAAVRVIDTGTGFSENVRDRIFEPFFTTKETGTGLGLSVVYGIVKQHGGFLTVQSKPGFGTTFEVFLPALAEGREGLSAGEAPVSLQPGNETILYVEDEADVRATVSEFLSLLGYRVITASVFEDVTVLQKPCSMESLSRRIRAVLEGQG